MKVAFFTPTLQIGGYEKVVVAFANHLADTYNQKITIVCGNDEGGLKSLISPKVSLVCLRCKTRNLLVKLSQYLKIEEPDVLYTGFRIYNSIAIMARALARNGKTKVLISQHGYEYQGGVRKKIHSLIQRKADGFIAVTENIRWFEQEALNLRCLQCVIGNPVIKEGLVISPSKDPWLDNHPIICVCSRLSQDKNVGLAIDILDLLHQSGEVYKLLILGDGPERRSLTEKVQAKNLSHFVRFQGYVQRPMDYMARCSVYLHTSDKEGFGNTVVEAMYTGLPVVTTDCGGPVELIENEKYGICFGSGHAKTAATRGKNTILYVVENRALFSGMKEKAEEFTVETATKKLICFIKKDDSE